MNNDDNLRYPVGKFQPKESYSVEEIQHCINQIEALPQKIENILPSLTTQKLDTPYRENGWTARQVLHHVCDSHINAYVRTKWTLTEDTPTIKAYDEKGWAQTSEVLLDPTVSINVLRSLHQKWVTLLRLLKPDEFKRSFFHPESKIHISLARQVATYAWHGEHHLAHLNIIIQKNN